MNARDHLMTSQQDLYAHPANYSISAWASNWAGESMLSQERTCLHGQCAGLWPSSLARLTCRGAEFGTGRTSGQTKRKHNAAAAEYARAQKQIII